VFPTRTARGLNRKHSNTHTHTLSLSDRQCRAARHTAAPLLLLPTWRNTWRLAGARADASRPRPHAVPWPTIPTRLIIGPRACEGSNRTTNAETDLPLTWASSQRIAISCTTIDYAATSHHHPRSRYIRKLRSTTVTAVQPTNHTHRHGLAALLPVQKPCTRGSILSTLCVSREPTARSLAQNSPPPNPTCRGRLGAIHGPQKRAIWLQGI